MGNLRDQIFSIEKKIIRVLQKLEELRLENNSLTENNTRLQKRIEELEGKTQSNAVLPTELQDNEEGFREVRSELDHYIQEIDQTIQLLNAE